MRRSWWRILSWAIVAVVGLLLVGWVRARTRESAPQVHYETTKADRGRVVAKVTATGTLSALVTVQVGSQVSGRVQRILVDFNSPVKEGQIIAALDPMLFRAAAEQSHANDLAAESNLKKAEAQAADAERQYVRATSLSERGLIAPSDFDTSRANRDVAQAQVDAARSGLAQAQAASNQAEVNLGYTTITSPIDGVVVARNVDVGQTVASAFQAPVLFVIAKDLRKMQVDTNVGEADVGKLRTGMITTFTVDAYPGERFTGTVRQIRNSPLTIQNVVTYDAVIDVENPDLRLKPGMTANVAFVVADKDRVLRVPNAAIRFQPDPAVLERVHVTAPAAMAAMGQKRLWILRDGRPTPISISTGVSDGSVTEVVQGDVDAGDLLITDMAVAPGKRFGLF